MAQYSVGFQFWIDHWPELKIELGFANNIRINRVFVRDHIFILLLCDSRIHLIVMIESFQQTFHFLFLFSIFAAEFYAIGTTRQSILNYVHKIMNVHSLIITCSPNGWMRVYPSDVARVDVNRMRWKNIRSNYFDPFRFVSFVGVSPCLIHFCLFALH